jgi:cell division protein FtsB
MSIEQGVHLADGLLQPLDYADAHQLQYLARNQSARKRAFRGECRGMAQRRRVRRRVGPSRIRWDRVGRIALVLVLFGVMVSYLNPMVNLLQAWQGSKASEQQLAQLEEERAALTRELREVSKPATLEREARKLGMVRPGEHAYVVHGLGN